MERHFVYADNSATTPVTERVFKAMLPYLTTQYGNPSGRYSKGREAKKALREARKTIAASLGAKPEEVFFTSGGSESDNWAIKGAALSAIDTDKRHIITTAIEHHAVLNTCKALRSLGFETTVLPVDKHGFVDPKDVKRAIRHDTLLVSIMAANNEVGTIEPIDDIGRICMERNIPFHTDAVQAVGHIPFDFDNQPISMLSLSGHKLGAVKGTGALLVKKGVPIVPLVDGGGQESGMRSGTENVAGCVGLAVAINDSCRDVYAESSRESRLRNRLIRGLLTIPGTVLNGSTESRLCNNVSVCFEGISGGDLLTGLDNEGICASAGSACSAGSSSPSHVLTAMGISPALAAGSLRLTIGRQTTLDDIDYMLSVIPGVVSSLRRGNFYKAL
ncbi:MAG: cysteine desulfurase [Oscillospiraceae bacterium]|nr:cysteine desulfurase [Oscillospiraceae bacterium]